jgi:light-regulated signal transduction histidine kinase (bacteriophytochrome)
MSAAPSPAQQLEQLQAELQAARAALGDFAYVVSHDLRAQLRHINAYSGLLREELQGLLNDDAAHFLDTVTNAAQLMGRQIDGLTTWSLLDRVALQPMAVEAATLVREAQQALAKEALGRDVQWQVADPLPRLNGDAALLRQLFTHLLSNALKFTRTRATAVIEIGVDAAPDGLVVIHVRDNGVGYNPTQQAKLFHVFQRLHSAGQFEGLGLGLALSRKIVERHGGSIAIDGTPDAGCRVGFTLPRAD